MSSPPWDGGPYAGPPEPTTPQYGYGAPQYSQPEYAQPPYGQPPYAQPPYSPQPYGAPPYGYPQQPGWGWAPYPPPRQRPGVLIAAAVLAFVSALLVVIGTIYAAAFGALLSLARGPDAGMSPWTALLQLALAGLLVVGGLRVLSSDRRWLWLAAAGQLVLSICWLVVLDDVIPRTFDTGVVVLPVLYGALAVVSAGLTFLPGARTRSATPPPAGG